MTIAHAENLAEKLRSGRMMLGGHRGNPAEVLEASRPVDVLRVMDDAEADVFCPHWAAIEPETAAELHAAGKLIGVWTVDDAFSLAWSKALPANAIYTNKPRTIRP